MRNGKNSTEMGFLGKYLNAICQDYVEKFQEIRAKHAGGTLEQARDVTSDIQKITDDMTPKCPSDSPEHAESHPAQDTPKPGTDSETPPGSEESSADLEHSSEMPAISELQPEAPPTSPFGLDSSELSPDIDALDILALLIVEKMGIKNADVAASRAFLSILIENEHLPVAGQLSAQELQALRNLLFCYFSGDANVNEKGAQVLALIEQKFANGFFSQARILLQIFETNQETRQNNERNLYYEEMILRLDGGPTKAKPVARNILQAACEDDADDETVLRALRAIEQNANITFNLYLRNLEELSAWQNALSPLPQHMRDYLLDYVPVIQWRALDALSEPIVSQLGRHMTFEMLRRHVQQKLRMCYFILLASGITGYEWFIFSFTQWSREQFNVDVRDVFPVLHRGGILDGMCLQEAMDVAVERFYGPAMNQISIQPQDLERAYRDALKFILQAELAAFPSGFYNFGDFVLDQLLPFHYEDPMFACRLHLMM